MIYKTNNGTDYDTSKLKKDELELFDWMKKEYKTCRSWIEFQQRTAHGIIEFAKKSQKDWQNHPLFVIQLDMVGKKGIETGELRGEITDKFN
ncbi:hypothetical protein HZA97_08145 [Candidatus Woesearchaeota archaeon]|nr:hypothetical protein [Candidatus Woesearchaeota archaeon]